MFIFTNVLNMLHYLQSCEQMVSNASTWNIFVDDKRTALSVTVRRELCFLLGLIQIRSLNYNLR